MTETEYTSKITHGGSFVFVGTNEAVVDAARDHPKYRRDIDGLRAIAILSVVTFHAAPGRLPGGFVGVDVFFVISGYLISSIIVSGLDHQRFSFSEFYFRRVKRIFPALLLVLFTCLVAGILLMTDEELTGLGKHVAAGAGFISNLALWSESGYFDLAANFKPLQHLWSLGIEEQFYIFWPLLLWLGSKRGARYLMLTLTIMAASFAVNLHQTAISPVAAFYSPFSRFWELLVGSSLACWLARPNWWRSAGGSWAKAASLAGLALLATAFAVIDKNRAFPGWWALVPTLGTALLILAGPNAWTNRTILSSSILVWVGRISYPLYLWHWPLLAFPRILEGTEITQWKRFVAILVAILLAWLTYEWLEKPIRRNVHTRTIALCFVALMSIVGLTGTYAYATGGFLWRPWKSRVVNAGDIGAPGFFDYVAKHFVPCTPMELRQEAVDGSGFLRCPQSHHGKKDIALIGDSHAEALFPGLAARLADKNIVFYGNGGGLPFVDNPDYTRIFDNVISDPNIKIVFVTAFWHHKLKLLPIAKWRGALTKTVAKLSGAGKRVYLVDDVPEFSFQPMRCKYDGRLGMKNLCTAHDENFEATYDPVFKEVAAPFGARLVAIHRTFCKDSTCSMAQNGSLLFRDEDHLSITGSMVAAKVIISQMGAP